LYKPITYILQKANYGTLFLTVLEATFVKLVWHAITYQAIELCSELWWQLHRTSCQPETQFCR